MPPNKQAWEFWRRSPNYLITDISPLPPGPRPQPMIQAPIAFWMIPDDTPRQRAGRPPENVPGRGRGPGGRG